jgi:hypothetical protein
MNMRKLAILALLLSPLASQAQIVRTAKGTANNKTTGTTLSLATVNITDKARIIVLVGWKGDTANPTVTWGSVTLSTDLSVSNGTDAQVIVFSGYVLHAATNTVTVTWPGATNEKTMTVTQVTGLRPNAYIDITSSATGSSVAPDAGSVSTNVANEYWLGVVATAGPVGDTSGTWQNTFSDGQRDGTTGGADNSNITVSEGFRIVSATGAMDAAKSGITSREWVAGAVAYINDACNFGDQLWVSETVSADTVGVNNNSSFPFGLQQAFRSTCPGAFINILAGTNHYDHNSASWTGRDDQPTDPTIYVGDVSGLYNQYVQVVGYADAMTVCALDGSGNPIAGCPVQVDFDKAFVGTGNWHGFSTSGVNNTARYYAWKFIRESNARVHGWNVGADGAANGANNWIWYRCRADGNGNADFGDGSGFVANPSSAIIASEADDNFADGINGAGIVINNKIYNNAFGGSPFGGLTVGLRTDSPGIVLFNALWNNGGFGIDCQGGCIALNNTVRTTYSTGATRNSGVGYFAELAGSGERTNDLLLWNVFSGNAGAGVYVSSTAMERILLGNNYSGNAPNVFIASAPIVPNIFPGFAFDEDQVQTGGEDTGAVTFISLTDPTPTGGTANTNFYFLDQPNSMFQKGAIQIRTTMVSGGGAGGNSAYAH